ncbi:uncharacterized protein LOC122045856 [Zingiber officinale]|uniref:Uncharacterized protein n=1 Tax=Zingiber officinale TaxID=94328 RepID=A0A8J5HGZ4_ZINOF|nr:uncharacterized protein LOC122045856 [Zingiber officinale]KAG6524247.1 hypothetical protein ZIOFF_014153 [Zingiber officinale]
MPTFTTVALERLLEPRSRDPATKPSPVPVERAERGTTVRKGVPRPNISPALYATPVTTPLPDSPSSFTLESPYLINHKRRGPRLVNGLPKNKNNAVTGQPKQSEVELKVDVLKTNDHGIEKHDADDAYASNGGPLTDEACDGKVQTQNLNIVKIGAEDVKKPVLVTIKREEVNEDSLDMHSIVSNSKVGDNCTSFGSNTSAMEFYDASEEFSTGCTPQPSYNNLDDDLPELKLNLLMETKKRTQAEESLDQLQNLWQRLSDQLSLLGLSLPISPNISEDVNKQSNLDPVEELTQQIVVTRFVADAISQGFAHAEVELEMEPQIAAKNFEITRLKDRLQYCEAANREMSQRNQEAVEMARRQRNKRKRRQRWVWGSFCFAISLSAAAIAWSYLPSSKLIPDEGDASTTSEQE